MTITLHRHFIEQILAQPPAVRTAVFEALLATPDAFRIETGLSQDECPPAVMAISRNRRRPSFHSIGGNF